MSKEYHGAKIDIPKIHYTISSLGEFVDWDVRQFFEKITTIKIDISKQRKE